MVAGTIIHICKWLQKQLCSTWNTQAGAGGGGKTHTRGRLGRATPQNTENPTGHPCRPRQQVARGRLAAPARARARGANPRNQDSPTERSPCSTGGGGLPPPLVLHTPARGRLAAPACLYIYLIIAWCLFLSPL